MEKQTEYIEMLMRDKSKNTVIAYSKSLNIFFDYFSSVKTMIDISSLTLKTMREFQSYLLGKGLSNSSVNSHIRNLRAFFNWLMDNEYIEKNPIQNLKDLKVGKRLPEYLTDEEIDKMMKACKNLDDRLMFSMMINLGVRRSELINIKCEDIDQYQNIKIIGKGNKERVLFIEDGVFELLKEYMETHTGEYLFNPQGKEDGPISGETLRLRLISIAKKAGLPEERIEMIHPHMLRHTTATRLIDDGVDINTIKEVMGHESITTTQIYAHVKNEKVRQAMNKKGVGSK